MTVREWYYPEFTDESHRELTESVWKRLFHTKSLKKACGRGYFTQRTYRECVAETILHKELTESVWQRLFHTKSLKKACDRDYFTQRVYRDCVKETISHKEFTETV